MSERIMTFLKSMRMSFDRDCDVRSRIGAKYNENGQIDVELVDFAH